MKNMSKLTHHPRLRKGLGDPRGVPGHIGGTNLDDKGMLDRFQALPGLKTGLKPQKTNGFDNQDRTPDFHEMGLESSV